MKVKDIVLAAADMLGMKEGVASFINGESNDFEQISGQLLTCLHLAECSLALNYVPLYAEDELLTSTGRLEFSSFAHSPVQIVDVQNASGESVAYTLYPQYLKAETGRLKVIYTYTPEEKGFEEDSDFSMLTSEHLLVYGTLAEYCLANGLHQEAAIWDKKLKDSVEYLCHTKKCKRLGSRRWI